MQEKEFEILIENTKGVVLNAIRRYLPSHLAHFIDDIAQEVYIRAYNKVEKASFENEHAKLNWFYTIAKNETIRMLEKSNRNSDKEVAVADAIRSNVGPSRLSTEESLDLKSAINKLSAKHRPVFRLLSLGLNERQIAEELSLKKGTVKSRISRGKKMLQAHLQSTGI